MATRDPLPRLRKLCLALPEATEKIAWGEPTFRVRDKIFAMYSNNHHGDGIVAVWSKAPPGIQELLVEADPERFYRPPYVGHKGWVGVRLDRKVDWEELAGLLEDSYRLTAPKRLCESLEAKPRKRSESAR
jgi:predicted DNA-binding protein (MmcQ/YjbR family)